MNSGTLNTNSLAKNNIRYFARYYKLVAIAVIITVAVIAGSLMVGDSVRTTLIKRVSERLGDTETIIFSRNSFMTEEMLDAPLFDGSRGIILTNGFVSHYGRLIPVFVWGVNDMSVSEGTAKINPSLARELSVGTSDDIVLRLPATGLVPSGSLFVTENYTTAIRLSFDGIVNVEEGGNISMKNEQTLPLNIFVNREELSETLEITGKINLILSGNNIPASGLDQVWNYTHSGLSVNRREDFTEITSDRVFIQDQVTESIRENNRNPNRLFSYLVNSIALGDTSIPYSFATASDRFQGKTLQKDEVILSDYSAGRLRAQIGDTVCLSYFTSQDLKTLSTDTVWLQVSRIVPLAGLVADSTLSADFPGLSDVERCTDWDSDLPINMDLITGEDEAYWEHYRSTPKAIIPYEAVAEDWGNAYGNATAIRLSASDPDLSGLRAGMFGIQVIYPREAGLYAARNGVDFSSLFLALGFFIIVSAILLMITPLSEMLFRRRQEIDLMKSLGYTRKRIAGILWKESAPLVLVSSIIGVIAGLLYTTLIMWLLGNVWKGATHTEGFSVYPGALTLLIGFVAGAGISLWMLRIVIMRSLKEKPHYSKQKTLSLKDRKRLTVLFSLPALVVIIVNSLFLHSVVLFVVVGVLLLAAAALWGDYLVTRNGSLRTDKEFNIGKLIWNTIYAGKKQALLSFFALATGVFIVFSVGLNRKGFADSSQIRTGTGGYTLWCESSVPVYHNMATQAGREKLSLTELPETTEILQCLRYGADEASCLNLNKVTTPTVLGVDMKALLSSDFRIEQNLYGLNREDFLDRMQISVDSVYPALVDATVLVWSLGMKLGDTLRYEGDNGQNIALQLVGTISNSVFQGHILIDRNLFSEIWKETAGSEVFLLKTDEQEREHVKNLLSQALNEYGVVVSTTNDRLKQFNTVTDTYLTIFLTLGGLGLLLGIMSFVIVIRKNLAMRRSEIELYSILGFPGRKIEHILYRENLIVPLYAIAVGVIASLVGVSGGIANIGIWVWILAVLFTLFFVLCVFVFVKKSVQKEVLSIQSLKSGIRNFELSNPES